MTPSKHVDPAGAPDATCTYAHLSDLHISSPAPAPAWQLLNKRALGFGSWRFRRRLEHRLSVLEAATQDLAAFHPDQIIITGDLTNLGLPQEFRQVGEWLATLGQPEGILVVPGNHDTYVRTPYAETFAHWSAYFGDAARSGRPECLSQLDEIFPFSRICHPVAFIGLCSARPSAPFLATGRLGRSQLERLERILAETGAQGLFRILLLHHPPGVRATSWRKRLTDGRSLQAVLDRTGAELVLHGHLHRQSLARVSTGAGEALVSGVPSTSSCDPRLERRAHYQIHRLYRTAPGWEIEILTRAWSDHDHGFQAAGSRRLRLRRD